MTTIIGVISDTHGLLRQEAIHLLQGSEIIVHAGDIGHPSVLDKLTRIAPVFAVKGNIDKEPWANQLPETEFIDHLGCMIYSLHNIADLDLDPAAAGINVVISGHSHRSEKKRYNQVLYLNPGSAGPRRFDLPISIARLYWKCESQHIDGEILDLGV